MFQPDHLSRHAFNCLFLIVLVLPLQIANAQAGGGVDLSGTGGKHAILGRIYFPSGTRVDSGLKVRLESTRYAQLSVLADANGNFGFRSLMPGSYTVVVEGGDLYDDVRETVFIDGEVSNPRIGIALPSAPRAYQLQIHLQPKRTIQMSAKPGVINAALAGVPESARKAYEKSLQLSQSGDNKKAIEQLKLAIAQYPKFAIALTELGVQYLIVGQVEPAVEALKSAVKLDPNAFSARLNYGIALLQKKSFAEAKTQLEDALQKNPNSATAHLYMGITLIHEGKYTDAEQTLQQAISIGKQGIALAHYYLGGLYWRRGEHKLAADELEKYVQAAPTAHDAEKIKATIKELRNRQ